MKVRVFVVALALGISGNVCLAADAFTGTWKLNEAKSKIGAGSPKLTTVVYETAGENVRVTVDGTGGDGKPVHDEWTGKFDGKDYPVTGDPNTDTRSYKRVNDHTLMFSDKKGVLIADFMTVKVTLSGRIVVSADGKRRKVTSTGTAPSGNRFTTAPCTTSSSGR